MPTAPQPPAQRLHDARQDDARCLHLAAWYRGRLPVPSRHASHQRLTLIETARFLFLIGQVRFLDSCLSAVYGHVERRECEPHGPTLLRLVRRLLAIHERIAVLLPGIPEPTHVQEVRLVLRRAETAITTPTGGE